ncbi:MAG: hypothetical protein HYY04_11525 [Chloroflexi bacterium]|nr:hypothetical protein [Chloroflexota bacterium]
MRTSLWAYPWDIADEGTESVLREVQELGFTAIDLAANYHAIATLAPHNPLRKVMYTDTGAVFFPARLDRYARIVPSLWPESPVLRAWPAVARLVADGGLTLNAWTIGMFQPWVTRIYPDTARVLPFGDRMPSGTCPANPDVQDYLVALGADLVEQYPIQLVELEGIGFPDFAYGVVRERIGIALSEWARYLLGLCFCHACGRAAAAEGIDVERLRRWVVGEVERRFAEAGDEPSPEPVAPRLAESGSTDPELGRFVELRHEAVERLVRRIARIVTGARPSAGICVPVRPDALDGLRLERVLDVIGAVMIPHPRQHPEEAAAIVQRVRASPRRIELVHNQSAIGPERPGSPGFHEAVQAAIRLGVDQISFYHHGLLKRPQLATISRLMREA